MTTGWTSTLERSFALPGWVIWSSRGPSIVRDLFSRLTCTCFWENRMVCARSPVCRAWLLHTHSQCTCQNLKITCGWTSFCNRVTWRNHIVCNSYNNWANLRALIGRRAMVYESIDHGSDITCPAVPVVLFLVFCKRNKCYCKKQIDHNFPWSTLL